MQHSVQPPAQLWRSTRTPRAVLLCEFFFPPLSLMSSQCKSRKLWWRPEGLLRQRWAPKLLSDTINASISKKVNISEVRGQLMRSNPCRYLPASIYMPSIIDSTQKEPFPRSEFMLGCIWTYWILVDRQIQQILNKVLELQIVWSPWEN